MKKHLFQVAAILLLAIFTQFLSQPTAHAAPGDFLSSWGAQQHFTDPAGVAVDENGNVYVTDIDCVQVFNSSGIRIMKWGSYGSGDGQFSYPTGIAVTRTGKVYVVDAGNNRIQVFDGSGKFLGKWGALNPDDIDVDGSGNVYVSNYSSVRVFDAEGNFLRSFATPGTLSIAVNLNGNLYLGQFEKVQEFSPTGTFIRTVIARPDIYCHGLAVDRGGNIYVAGGNFHVESATEVHVYDSSGSFLRRITFTEQYYQEHLWEPSAVAVDKAGNAYVLDFGNDGLRVFDGMGNALDQWWTYGTGDRQLNMPTGILVDKSGNVYETDGPGGSASVRNNRIRVFDGEGNFLRKWLTYRSDNDKSTSGIAMDEGGKLYVLNTVSIELFDSSGNFLDEWLPYDDPLYALFEPFGIAVDKSGNVLVTDTGHDRVAIFDKEGNFLRELGTSGSFSDNLFRPEGIAIDELGNIFVSDTGHNRIQVFDSAYNFVRKWGSEGSGDGQFFQPSGIAIDPKGNVIVADTRNNRIQVFDKMDNFLLKWGSEGDENGLFREPRGVAVNREGTRIYVADTWNNRIQVFAGYGAAPTYSVSGTVRQGSTTGAILAGATVTIAGKSAITSSTGTFAIAGITAGYYRFTISKTGYLTKTSTVYLIQSNRSGFAFYLTPLPTYSVSGTVRQRSGTGPALAGATVTIAGKTTKTYSNGSFRITGIPAGSYRFTISKPGYVTRTTTVYLIQSNRSGLVFYLTPAPTYSVSGTVRQGSSSGPALAGATVKVAGKTATTSSTGSFSVTGIPAGTYTFTISKYGFVTKTTNPYLIQSNRSGLVFYLTAAP